MTALRIDDTGFGSIRLTQDTDYFCYGTDAVLLADFASRNRHFRAADLGTNNAVIPLLMSAITRPGSRFVEDRYLQGEEAIFGLLLLHRFDNGSIPHVRRIHNAQKRYEHGLLRRKDVRTADDHLYRHRACACINDHQDRLRRMDKSEDDKPFPRPARFTEIPVLAFRYNFACAYIQPCACKHTADANR